jgi:hypothetical protein
MRAAYRNRTDDLRITRSITRLMIIDGCCVLPCKQGKSADPHLWPLLSGYGPAVSPACQGGDHEAVLSKIKT